MNFLQRIASRRPSALVPSCAPRAPTQRLPLEVIECIQQAADNLTFIAMTQVCRAWRDLPTRGHLERRLEEASHGHAYAKPDQKTQLRAALLARLRLLSCPARAIRLGRATLNGHTAGLTAAAFSPGSRCILTASRDGSARRWDLSKLPLVPLEDGTMRAQGELRQVTYAPNGRFVAALAGGLEVLLWDLNARHVIEFLGHAMPATHVAFSSDSRKLVTASLDGTALVWEFAADDASPIELRGHRQALTSASFGGDPRYVLTTSCDGAARVWDLQRAPPTSVVLAGHRHRVTLGVFSADLRFVLTASSDNEVRVWSWQKEPPSYHLLRGHMAQIHTAAFSPCNRYVVTASADETARVWNWRHNSSNYVDLQGHRGAVNSAEFSPDGRHVVTASSDRTARLWEPGKTPPLQRKLTGHTGAVTSAAFSPNGRFIVTGCEDGTARLWDSHAGKAKPATWRVKAKQRLKRMAGHGSS